MAPRAPPRPAPKTASSRPGLPVRRHFVVQRPVTRTKKLLAAMSLLPGAIVHEEWLVACESAGKFVDVTPYLLNGAVASDPRSSKIKWSFDAVRSSVSNPPPCPPRLPRRPVRPVATSAPPPYRPPPATRSHWKQTDGRSAMPSPRGADRLARARACG